MWALTCTHLAPGQPSSSRRAHKMFLSSSFWPAWLHLASVPWKGCYPTDRRGKGAACAALSRRAEHQPVCSEVQTVACLLSSHIQVPGLAAHSLHLPGPGSCSALFPPGSDLEGLSPYLDPAGPCACRQTLLLFFHQLGSHCLEPSNLFPPCCSAL